MSLDWSSTVAILLARVVGSGGRVKGSRGEAAVVSGNAAVACQLIRATANLATGASYFAPVLSLGARVPFGFARVA